MVSLYFLSQKCWFQDLRFQSTYSSHSRQCELSSHKMQQYINSLAIKVMSYSRNWAICQIQSIALSTPLNSWRKGLSQMKKCIHKSRSISCAMITPFLVQLLVHCIKRDTHYVCSCFVEIKILKSAQVFKVLSTQRKKNHHV